VPKASPPPDVPPISADEPTAGSPDAGFALPGRLGVGLCAGGCFAGALAVYVVRPDEVFWWAGAMRVGIVMGALWLALPSRKRDAAWAAWDFKAVSFVALCALLSFRLPQIGVPLLAGWWFWRWLKAVPPTGDAPRD